VPEIVPFMVPGDRVLLLQPPPGLLDVGCQELLVGLLRQELAPYAPPCADVPTALAATVAEGAGGGLGGGGGSGGSAAAAAPLYVPRWMPTRQQLVDAGRADLLPFIERLGGFLQVWRGWRRGRHTQHKGGVVRGQPSHPAGASLPPCPPR
jgi:hypothetical protein